MYLIASARSEHESYLEGHPLLSALDPVFFLLLHRRPKPRIVTWEIAAVPLRSLFRLSPRI
jgi:hypothetical protein